MNCSMMYKAFLFAMVLFLIPVCNAKAETREDLLLIYQDNLSKEQTENVKLFSETLTALGKKLDFQNETDAQEVLDDYPYVICYDIKDADEKFLKNFVFAELLHKLDILVDKQETAK